MEVLSSSDTDLISFLSSSLPEPELDKARRLIASREKSLKAEMECIFLDELSLKEVEKIEAKHRGDVLEREAHALRARCMDLENKIDCGVEVRRNLEEVMKRCDLLEIAMDVLQKEVLEWKMRHEEVVTCFSELMEENSRLRSFSERNDKPVEDESMRGVVDISNGKNGKMGSLSTYTPKRKSGLTIVSTDSEGDDGSVRIPTGMLFKRRRRLENIELVNEGTDELGVSNSSFSRDKQSDGNRVKRLLFPSPECRTEAKEINARCHTESSFGDESPTKNIRRTSSTPESVKRRLVISDSDDDVSGEEDSESGSESTSLDGFIVSGSDFSGGNHTCSGATDENSACDEEESTSAEDFDVLLAKISGKREDENNWEYEADMLASFAKDPELCMEAVCALYRKQTEEEKSVKGAIVLNSRGFNTCDAHRGSMMAEFLMDGDPQCRLRKSVNELEMYGPGGPDYCHMLANRYSKQLFSIYKNNEDPFFHPSSKSSSR